jgi:hypothetical protein
MEENVERLGPTLLKAFPLRKYQTPATLPESATLPGHPDPGHLCSALPRLHRGHSRYAIFQWGREHEESAPELDFKEVKTPVVSILHEVFRRLDKEAFEAVPRKWAQEKMGDRGEAVAIGL